VQESSGDVLRLTRFNELQHQNYGRLRALCRDGTWTLESFLNGLIEKPALYRIGATLDGRFKSLSGTFVNDAEFP
jgi:hypothetical protein